MQPDDSDLREIPGEQAPLYEVSRIVDVVCCPRYGKIVQDGEEQSSEPMIYDEYVARNEPTVCERCGDKLPTNAINRWKKQNNG